MIPGEKVAKQLVSTQGWHLGKRSKEMCFVVHFPNDMFGLYRKLFYHPSAHQISGELAVPRKKEPPTRIALSEVSARQKGLARLGEQAGFWLL